MTTPHDDDLRSELLDVPDHGPEFWTALDAELATEERENVVPLAPGSSARSRSRGLLLAAAVVAVLGGIGAWFAFSGDDEGPDVAVDPEPSVTTAPDPTAPPPTVVDAAPVAVVRSMTATVERVSATGLSGTFGLVADQDGTVVLRSDDAEFGYHSPSGATWSREGDTWMNEIDPISGRDRLWSLLFLDLAEAIRYGERGTPGERDGRHTIEATVELVDNESAGWFDRSATVVIDDETGFVLDATVTGADGGVVEELRLTDLEWSDEPFGFSGAVNVGVDSEWAVFEELPWRPVVSDRFLVPEGMEPTRVFTTGAPVTSGSESGNPASDGAYVVDVTTGPWRLSKVVVLGRSLGWWRNPFAEEGWLTETESVTPAIGVLDRVEGELVAEPPLRPRAWFGASSEEIVAVSGLGDPTTAERLWNLQPRVRDEESIGAGLGRLHGRLVFAPPDAESAITFRGILASGSVVARRVDGGAAEMTAWPRAVDGIWLELPLDSPGLGMSIEPRGRPAETCPCPLDSGDAHAVVLLDAFVDDDGEIGVVYGEIPSPDDPQPAEASLWLQGFGRPHADAVELGSFVGPEYGVDAASGAGDRIVASAGADLAEVFTFYHLDGNEVEEPNNPVPVGHRYNEPPNYQQVALAPDGRSLAFIEGPEWDRGALVGDWELVVVDLDSGDETARIAVGVGDAMQVTRLDFDGTWAIVSRATPIHLPGGSDPVPAVAVDTADGTVTELGGTTGIVTLAR